MVAAAPARSKGTCRGGKWGRAGGRGKAGRSVDAEVGGEFAFRIGRGRGGGIGLEVGDQLAGPPGGVELLEELLLERGVERQGEGDDVGERAEWQRPPQELREFLADHSGVREGWGRQG